MFAVEPKFMNLKSVLGALLRKQEGATAVLVALSLSALLGIVALSFDLSRAYNLQTELGQAADASALAGATQLDNTLGSVRRACQAAGGEATYPCTSTGVTIGDAIVVNQEKFSSEGLAGDVDALQIEFLVSLGTGPGSAGRVYVNQSGPEADADATANFIEVSVVPRTVYFPFAAAIGVVVVFVTVITSLPLIASWMPDLGETVFARRGRVEAGPNGGIEITHEDGSVVPTGVPGQRRDG